MNLTDALTEFGNQIGLPELTLDDNGLASVTFDDDLNIDFESMEGGQILHLSSVLSTFNQGETEEQEESLFERLLQANLLGIATGGAHFSINENDSEVLLEQALTMEGLDYTTFVNEVENFVNHVESWKEEFNSKAYGVKV